MYEMMSTANKIFIMKNIYKLKMKDETTMLNHISELNTLLCQAHSIGLPWDDKNKVFILLCSLPNSWDGVVTLVNTSITDKNKLVYDEVISTLLSEDMRRTNKEFPSNDALTMVSIENSGRT